MESNAGNGPVVTSGQWAGFSNDREALLTWKAELLDEITGIEKELKYLLNKKELLHVKIQYFCKWSLSTYSQLKLKAWVELEQTNKDIAKTEKKVVFLKELLKKIENELQGLQA